MRALLVAMVLIGGCVESGKTPDPTSPGVALCGEQPVRPGTVVAFDNDTASMSRADYIALNNWLTATDTWGACMSGK